MHIFFDPHEQDRKCNKKSHNKKTNTSINPAVKIYLVTIYMLLYVFAFFAYRNL